MVRFGRRIPELLLAAFVAYPHNGGAFSVENHYLGSPRTFPERTSATATTTTTTVASAAASNEDWDIFDESSGDNLDNYKKREMLDTTSESSSDIRKRKEEKPSLFSTGEELKRLRMDLESYRENLKWAEVINDEGRIESLSKEIEEKERRDPELVYNKAQYLIAEAEAASSQDLKPDLKEKLIEHWSEQATLARACLPRFQMEGLWVGNYGGGPQLVNITYAGDTLVATKVTDDDTVPRGETSFTANLSPPPLNNTEESGNGNEASSEYSSGSPSSSSSSSSSSSEEHTVLQSKYGESIFPGQGQLSKKNFKDSKFISGVLIVYDSHRFSFSWVPTKHHVFFVRPSPQETLRLLRDVISREDEVENMRNHLTRCFDMDRTTSIAQDDLGVSDGDEDSFRRIKSHNDLKLLQAAMKNIDDDERSGGGSIFKFWRANKWRKYIDRVLGQDEMDSMK